jgi:hypothetical protein
MIKMDRVGFEPTTSAAAVALPRKEALPIILRATMERELLKSHYTNKRRKRGTKRVFEATFSSCRISSKKENSCSAALNKKFLNIDRSEQII